MAQIADVPETTDRRARMLERYRQDTDLPLMVLAISVVPLLCVEYFADLKPRAEAGIQATYTLIWAAFVADYLIRLWLSPSRRAYVRAEWFELLVNIVTIPVALNPLAILRSARALRLLRLLRFGAVAARGARRVVRLPRSHNSQLAVALATFLLLALVSSVLVLALEEGQRGSQINTMGDALWWAVATVTTAGYGDVVPKQLLGRILAILLMFTGVGLVGVVIANFAGRLMAGVERRVGQAAVSAEEQAFTEVAARLDEISERLARLEARIGGGR